MYTDYADLFNKFLINSFNWFLIYIYIDYFENHRDEFLNLYVFIMFSDILIPNQYIEFKSTWSKAKLGWWLFTNLNLFPCSNIRMVVSL